MRLKMMIIALSALFLMTGSAIAADLTGTWVAEMAAPKMGGGPGGGGPGGGQQGPRKFIFNLKEDGAKLSGTVKGPRGNENEIIDGKIDGDKVSFAVKVQGFQGNEMKIKYEGSVSGDELTLNMSFEGGMGGGPGGGGMQMPPLVAKRQK